VRSTLLLSIGVVLILTASGAAYETSNDSSSGTIVACVHHKGGGLYVASKCAPHDGRLALKVGGSLNVMGTPTARLFAQITANGTINASSPGVTASQFLHHTGTFRVNFGQNITRCAAIATQGALPEFGTPGASTTRVVGSAVVDMFAPGYTFPNGYPSADTVQVETFAGSTHANAPFYITVSC
jgi:hypothetical protein